VTEPLDELYLTWLYSQVGSVKLKNKVRTYWCLLRRLYQTEFVWQIPNDDNRIEDGRDLRQEFLESEQIDADADWVELGCSMLELLIVLSRRLSFLAEGEPSDWFWHMIDNLDIHVNDRDYNETREGHIDETLNRVVWRQYAPDGRGGIFPLRRPEYDQRDVELWYQLNAYLLEII
jgi:hypothetical protein